MTGAGPKDPVAALRPLPVPVETAADPNAMAGSRRAPTNLALSLADELESRLSEWLKSRALGPGPNGHLRNDVAGRHYQAGLRPRHVALLTSLGGRTAHRATYALLVWGRAGVGMDSARQKHPWTVGLDEKHLAAQARTEDGLRAITALGEHPNPAGPAVEFLLAYRTAVYLGVLSGSPPSHAERVSDPHPQDRRFQLSTLAVSSARSSPRARARP
ncbi:MAG: hypothetical protein FJ029_08420 [Actinobacteria bacterium]|nr:hypothetical protein [Actinomycetota bacterium]